LSVAPHYVNEGRQEVWTPADIRR